MIVHCEINLYSGQTNPSWELTAGESANLFVRLKTLPGTTAGKFPDKLGYRGILVTLDGEDGGSLRSAEAYDGLVRTRTGDGKEHWHDDRGRAFERWLLQTGQSHIDKDLYSYVDHEFGP